MPPVPPSQNFPVRTPPPAVSSGMEANTPRADGDDWRLFRAAGDVAAFARLVRSLTDLVHSAALRVVQDAGLAQDVTQAVFLLLAKKGRSLPAEVQPGPWCWRQAVRLATNAVRTESRRRNREQLYAVMNEPSNTEETWMALSPVLDEALARLPETDQAVIIGKYFERQEMSVVGRRLGISAEAAQKRASRALEKLRTLLHRRGVGATAAMLGYSLKTDAVSAAPATLAAKCVKAASTAIPAGKWLVLLSYFNSRTAAAGLAAGLTLTGSCAWQLHETSVAAERKNASLTAALSEAETSAATTAADFPSPATPQSPRLAFAEILRQLAATHWQPDNLATQKRIAWLLDQIDPSRLPDTARWMLDRRHYRQREPMLAALWSSWLERAPEACADFWTDEIHVLSDEGSWYHPWLSVKLSLGTAVSRSFDAARLDAWFQRRIAADPALLHAPGWKGLAQAVLLKRLNEDPSACTALLTRLPSGPARARFLRESFGPIQSGYVKAYAARAALDAFHAIPDETLRREAVSAVLQRTGNSYDRTALDWWLQLPPEQRLFHAQDVLTSSTVIKRNYGEGATKEKFNQSGVEEILQQIPEEKRAPLLIRNLNSLFKEWQEPEPEVVALALPALHSYHAVQKIVGNPACKRPEHVVELLPSQLKAAAAVTDAPLQERLLRGIYGTWHDSDPAAAEAFLKQSGWSPEIQAMLRAAALPLEP
ncbi:MAG TPA: sigma-70 family RNA polymerase sigma factor [Verrucomicrobiales bacterium]|nr:sigma-70 family RNA polymerase sigma factor [Verrucomicrobiales bacterium]